MANRSGGADWLGCRNDYQQALIDGRLEAYRNRRWQRAREFAGWLGEQNIPSLTADQAQAIYRASGGRQNQEFKDNPIEEVRDSLDFLLFDTLGLEKRFDESASTEGAYNLAGSGKEFVSYILCLREPGLFAFWSSHGERALRKLGVYPKDLRKGNLGLGYMDLLEAVNLVRGRMGLADFQAVDEFFYSVTQKRPEPLGERGS